MPAVGPMRGDISCICTSTGVSSAWMLWSVFALPAFDSSQHKHPPPYNQSQVFFDEEAEQFSGSISEMQSIL
jgi:hypothetical protein